MSWNVQLIGKPANIIKALQEKSTKLDGQSKLEYDEVLPHLVGVVAQNLVSEMGLKKGYCEQTMRLDAAGHGVSSDGEPLYRSCRVALTSLDGTLV